MRRAVVHKRIIDRRKEQMGYQRDLPKCEICRYGRGRHKASGIVGEVIFVCDNCLGLYKGKSLREFKG